jgi:hypothetical protein
MKARNIAWIGLFIAILHSSCSDDTRLELAATAFKNAAQECMLDVRDHKMKYNSSPACASLGKLSLEYLEAGGEETNIPSKYALIAEQGRSMAWTALAISESGGKPLKLW